MAAPQKLQFERLLDLSNLPRGSSLECFSFDWSGEPLMLVSEGKSPFPSVSKNVEARVAWHNQRPTSRYVVHWESGKPTQTTLTDATGILSHFIQRFDDGWVLADGRGGSASVYSNSGTYTGTTFDFGDAIKDVQTTPSGDTWVSYFDEGVYGRSIGQYGLVCFGRDGLPKFKYHEVSQARGLPVIDDLYAMNVVSDSEIWLCYYSDFPIVRLEGFNAFTCWPEVAPIQSLAISDGAIFAARAYEQGKLFRAELEKGQWRTTDLQPIDKTGEEILAPFHTCARRNKLALMTQAAVYIAEV